MGSHSRSGRRDKDIEGRGKSIKSEYLNKTTFFAVIEIDSMPSYLPQAEPIPPLPHF